LNIIKPCIRQKARSKIAEFIDDPKIFISLNDDRPAKSRQNRSKAKNLTHKTDIKVNQTNLSKRFACILNFVVKFIWQKS